MRLENNDSPALARLDEIAVIWIKADAVLTAWTGKNGGPESIGIGQQWIKKL
jgi:hypothetical protein